MISLTEEPPIDLDTYLNDQIEIRITGLSISGTESAYYTTQGFLENLRSIANEELPNGLVLFNKPTGGMRRNLCTLSMTKNGRAAPLRPLFYAEIDTISKTEQHTQVYDPASIKLKIIFNPTRFCRHWLNRSRALELARGNVESIPLHDLFSRDRIEFQFEDEIINKRKDNVILIPLQRHWLTKENRDQLLNLYITSVVNALLEIFNRAARAANAHIFNSAEYSLRRVETYWEQYHSNVYAVLTQIQNNIMRFGRFNEHLYRNMTSRSVRQNEHSISIEPKQGVRFVAYAKSNKRVRYEIRQFCPQQRQSRTGSSLDELFELISERNEMAIANARRLQRYMTAPATQEPRIIDLVIFLREFNQRFENHLDAAHIFNLLVANHHIEIGDVTTVQRRAIDSLTRADILVKTGRGVRAVKIDYQPILEHLSRWNEP